MSILWTEPFRHENLGQSLYPFGDASTLRTTSGLALDRDAILDLTLHPEGAAAGLSLLEVAVEPGLVRLSVGMPPRTVLATATFDPSAPPTNLRFADALGRPAGLAVCDPTALATLGGWPRGTHRFAAGAAEFAARCAVAWPEPGVSALVAGDQWLDDEAWLVGGLGVVISVDADGAIRIDAEGDPLSRQRRCEGSTEPSPPSVLKALVVIDDQGRRSKLRPDRFGNIALVPVRWTRADQAMRVSAEGSTLTIEAAASV